MNLALLAFGIICVWSGGLVCGIFLCAVGKHAPAPRTPMYLGECMGEGDSAPRPHYLGYCKKHGYHIAGASGRGRKKIECVACLKEMGA